MVTGSTPVQPTISSRYFQCFSSLDTEHFCYCVAMLKSNGPTASERLFFALWPDDAVRRALCVWQSGKLPVPGRWVVPANLHLTLVFLGNVTADVRDCLCQGADTLQLPQFSLTLDTTGCWSTPKVAWLSASELTPELLALVSALRQVASDCDLPPEVRDFVPHVTVARKLGKPPPAWDASTAPAIEWPATGFVLVRSETWSEGVVYQPIRHWALVDGDARPGR